jgi:C4-type Zn-finger protein
MRVELQCPVCARHFDSNVDARLAKAVEHLMEVGPWFALGDGETVEDRIAAELTDQPVACPHCGHDLELTEEGLGSLSRELLAQW